MTDQLNKLRVYVCPTCHNQPCRPLNGDPKPCDVCQTSLSGLPYRIEDYLVYTETILKTSRPGNNA